MKKTMTTILLSALCMFSYSQQTDSTKQEQIKESEIICKSVDEFTDEVDFYADGSILYKDGGDMKTQGIVLQLFLKQKKRKLQAGTLYLKVAGMRGCIDEGSTLIVMFENGEKTTLVNWNSFNCKGTNYFSISDKLELFKNNKIKAIKYTNTKTYESMVVKDNINSSNESFIMDMLSEIDKINSGELTTGICK